MTMPVSVKGIVVVEGRVLLLRNERDEWDLPGGRPDAGEAYEATVAREAREEANVLVEALDCLDDWPYEVLPGRSVRIVSYGCAIAAGAAVRLSDEHHDLLWAPLDRLTDLPLPEVYRRAIGLWVKHAESPRKA